MPFKNQLKTIAQNIFPGFVVSLIALPLALGLALASGAPPIAGIIASIVGGIVVAFIGGSNVAIVGPGNGLVVVTLAAITTLGAGDMYQGYLFTLAAVVLSGAVIFLLGLLRFGALSEFFPSAAVQGMLAAIGLIIMAKQIHLMLGVNNPEATGAIALLLEVPASLALVFKGNIPAFSYIFGLGALAFLFLYSRFRGSFIQLVPAPMWVVMVGIGLSYLAQLYPGLLDPLPHDYLVTIPDNILNNLAFPDFGKITEPAFFSAVLSLTFISSIESLLSMKAVDRLDPLKRRTNVNRGLRAIGMATVISGFLGGLNVVKVIARSSVNVNQGANNRASNFFHGLFLLIFVVLFTKPLQHIPLSALAAILVFTGYKLCSPSVFKSIARVGWEQLAIFCITLFSTLLTNLLTGILIGVIITLLSQLSAIGRTSILLRNLVRPNTLLFKEDEEQYHLSVRAFSNFLNFIGIKKKLDTLPASAKVIVDFSLCQFVDYSVLEQLHTYHHRFKASGGDLEIIGIDDLDGLSTHPLASRRSQASKTDASTKLTTVTRRQKSMRLFAKKLNWQFVPEADFSGEDFYYFKYFLIRKIDNCRNRAEGWQGRVKIVLADLHYFEGEYTAQQHLHSTMVELIVPYNIPSFILNKENLLDKVAGLSGFEDINFEQHPDFSHRFNLKGDDPAAIKGFFKAPLITFFEENKDYHLESNGKGLLIFEKERLSTISEIKQLVSFANRLAQILNAKK